MSETKPSPPRIGNTGLTWPLCAVVARGKVTGGGAAAGRGATVVGGTVVVVGGMVVVVARGRVAVVLVVGVTEAEDPGRVVTEVIGAVVVADVSRGSCRSTAPAGDKKGVTARPRTTIAHTPMVTRATVLTTRQSVCSGVGPPVGQCLDY